MEQEPAEPGPHGERPAHRSQTTKNVSCACSSMRGLPDTRGGRAYQQCHRWPGNHGKARVPPSPAFRPRCARSQNPGCRREQNADTRLSRQPGSLSCSDKTHWQPPGAASTHTPSLDTPGKELLKDTCEQLSRSPAELMSARVSPARLLWPASRQDDGFC
jgi:hypothetical protein